MLYGHCRIYVAAKIHQPISPKYHVDCQYWHVCSSTQTTMCWVTRAGQSATCRMGRTIKFRLSSMLVSVDVWSSFYCTYSVISSTIVLFHRSILIIFYCFNIDRHTSQNIVKAALRAVGNIVTGDDAQTQVILNSGALPHILHLLSSDKESIRKEASWTISNITAGNRQQIQAVIDANIFPTLIHILKNDEFKTRKEAAWSITNATSSGTAEQIQYLVCYSISSNSNNWQHTTRTHTRTCINFHRLFNSISGSGRMYSADVRSVDCCRLSNHSSSIERPREYPQSRWSAQYEAKSICSFDWGMLWWVF